MYVKVRLMLIALLLNVFFSCKTSFLRDLYDQNYQLINTIGIMAVISAVPGLLIKKQLESGPDGKKMSLQQTVFFYSYMVFFTKEW